MQKVHVKLDVNSYDIYIGPGIINETGNMLKEMLPGKRIAVVTDTQVGNHYGKNLMRILRKSGFDPVYFSIEPGESSKNIETVESLCTQFVHAGLDRNSSVIAFGGGVVGDVAGFAAAIYLRGIQYVQIPSTLLADCDSAVGGKVGVNLNGTKNLIGSFYQPKAVIIDPDLLKTLPYRQISAGLAEVIKTGLIGNPDLYDLVFANLDDILNLRDMDLLCDIIKKSVLFKADIVSRDEKESGLRRILNFGHTIGHGIEGFLGGGSILHGEAVLYGMLAASWISRKKGTLNDEKFGRIVSDLIKLKNPADISNISFESITDLIKKDKKRLDNRLHFILLEDIGKTYESQSVEESDIFEALSYIQGLN
ncbi:3-dehydroquinate synthase [candidate division KSB1 bacterium]|nr:3-dehydroquinate synthase [candidate division KSB1 bacterium]